MSEKDTNGDDEMTQYLLSVWHAEDDEVYPDEATMQRAFTQVNAFNEELQALSLIHISEPTRPY